MEKYKFDIHREDLYMYDKPELRQRTEDRLKRIAELGMSEVGIAQFGYKGKMSGLYIEIVWNYSDEKFDDYLKWAEEVINRKELKNFTDLLKSVEDDGYRVHVEEGIIEIPYMLENPTEAMIVLRDLYKFIIQLEIV